MKKPVEKAPVVSKSITTPLEPPTPAPATIEKPGAVPVSELPVVWENSGVVESKSNSKIRPAVAVEEKAVNNVNVAKMRYILSHRKDVKRK